MVRDTPPSQDASTHQIWNSYLKEYRRYAPDTKQDGRTDGHFITIKTKSEIKVKVKVIVTRKWYVTFRYPKMHPHQIWNSYFKEYRRYAPDMKRDGRTVRLLYASQSSFGGIKISKHEYLKRKVSAFKLLLIYEKYNFQKPVNY